MDSTTLDGVEQLRRIKITCARIFQNQKDGDAVVELRRLISASRPTIVRTLEPIIFSVFFPVLKSIAENKESFKEKEKQQIVDTFKALFDKIQIEKLNLYFNIYGFLLYEIYDHKNHKILPISEEYKLSIVECMTALARCLSSAVVEQIYIKENAPKLCQMLYVLLELAKNEQFRTLRVASIDCIMAIAHVLDDNDINDLVLRNQIAEVFLFFLPGVASQLKSVALAEEKHGHKVPTTALRAWGRIVTLLMQDYGPSDQKITVSTAAPHDKKWKDETELKDYIKNTQRSPQWYQETDKRLQQVVVEFSKLCHHSHPNVRLELVQMAELLVENCIHTMPTSVSHLVDIIISLSGDSDGDVSGKSRRIIDDLSVKLTESEFKPLLDNLEESFYSLVNSMPRKFNAVDERVQIVALNSLIGYISLFGKHNLTHVLHSSVHLNRLLLTLIHVSEFDKSGISILEEYSTPDYDLSPDIRPSWKNFRHFKDPLVLDKLGTVCQLLAKHGASSLVTHFLLDIVVTNAEQRKEATFLLNEIVAGLEGNDANLSIFNNVVATYIDANYWYLPLTVMVDDFGYEHTLSDVQDNVMQVSLLVEGLEKVASTLQNQFRQFLLKTLYLVLERAGSPHPVIRGAGQACLGSISSGCGYTTITDLINANIDYFSFHIQRKLNRGRGGLEVLAVVIKYSTKEVLDSTCEVVHELLLRTYEGPRTNLNSYFQVFKIFILGVHQWIGLDPEEPFKTKKQKRAEFEEFRVSNIEPIEDVSEDRTEKTIEEMYQEDSESKDEPEYKKPEPPVYIKLTVAILARSLHYLPSKDQTRKLLVLEILKNGLPILKQWEDELLPIVHQIWSPLVDRFKEEACLIVIYSFQLLATLALASKDFIRSRTAKDVLPEILRVLEELAPGSYLKDKGAAYRYSHKYKLQLIILENLARIVTDLDMAQNDIEKAMEAVFGYISDKQPLPLQKAAIGFYKTLLTYDPGPATEKLELLTRGALAEHERNLGELRIFCSGLE